MKLIASFRNSLSKNPFAWVWFGVFLIAEHANYQKGHDLDRICDLTGPHDMSYDHPRTDKEIIDTLCLSRPSPDDEPDNNP